MSDNQNWIKTGEQIKDALTDALQSGNFSDLNRLVSQTVTNTLDDAGIHISLNGFNTSSRPYDAKSTVSEQPQPTAAPITTPAPVRMQKIGNVSRILYQVFGGIGLGITAIITLARLLAFIFGETSVAGWITNFIFLVFFSGMIRVGIDKNRRLARAKRYASLCRDKMFGTIDELAKATGQNVRYVIKDLQQMLKLGFFPEGHLDEQNTCFMLSDSVYKQYLDAEDGRRQRELAQQELADSGVQKAPLSPSDELNTIYTEGMEYVHKLRDLNDRIAGEVISAKLFRLEKLLKEIFEQIQKHPEQTSRMHTLMNYYLPTMLKLVEAYAEFDQVSSPGEEILNAKTEIENTLDTINEAFTELLNNLFQDAVFDATTDAQVLKTMLARDGLTREKEFAPVNR